MFQLIKNFDKELTHAIEIAKGSAISAPKAPIHNIVVSGMGGSGIGGSFIHNLVASELRVPYIVNKGYFLPKYVNEHSLVIICSYSGNTEESVNAISEAQEANAQIVVITSGGQLLSMSQELQIEHVIIPDGRPPRASMGYSMVQILSVLIKKALVSDTALNEMSNAIEFIQSEQETIILESMHLAAQIGKKFPIIYCEENIESVAVRWKQQFNENAKMLCLHNIYPELNHNELVGWREKNEDIALLILKTGEEYKRNQYRMQLNLPIFKAITPTLHEIVAKGNNKTEKLLYLIHFGDWLSYHLAEIRGYDAMEIDVLIQLKNDLATM